MAIDRTFGSALNKALRGLEQAGVGPLAEDAALGADLRLPRRGLRRRPGRRRADPAGSTRPARRASPPATPSGRPPRSCCAGSSRRPTAGCGGCSGCSAGACRRRSSARRPGSPPGSSPRWAATSPSRPRSPRPARAWPIRATPRRPSCSRRSSGPGFGDRELAGLAGTTRGRAPGGPAGARPAPGLRDGRHVRRGVRRRDAVLLLDLRRGRLAARGAAGRRARRPSSSAPGRSGSGRASSSTTAPSRRPTRSAAPAGARS